MYKYLSIILVALMVVGTGGFLYKNHQWKKRRVALNNQLAKVQKTQQETETARSRLAIQLGNLKASNKDLQEIISDRDEEIVAKTNTEIKWKNKYFKSIKAKQSTTDQEGNFTEPGSLDSSEERVKVEFEHLEDPYKIIGFTLTNPPYAEVKLEWTRSLKLELILTKNDDDIYRVYLDSENKDIVPAELSLQVDPSVFEAKWYERLGAEIDLGVGHDPDLIVRALLKVFYNINIMKKVDLKPQIKLGFNPVTQKATILYGVGILWYPFR